MAGRGTTWLSHLAASSDADTAQTMADPLDELAMDGVLTNAIRLGKPSG